MKITRKAPRKRKSRSAVAAARGYSHVSRSGMAEASDNVHALNGLLAHDSRVMRDSEPERRDTNANRKNGGYSTYYRMREGFGQMPGGNLTYPATSKTTRNGK